MINLHEKSSFQLEEVKNGKKCRLAHSLPQPYSRSVLISLAINHGWRPIFSPSRLASNRGWPISAKRLTDFQSIWADVPLIQLRKEAWLFASATGCLYTSLTYRVYYENLICMHFGHHNAHKCHVTQLSWYPRAEKLFKLCFPEPLNRLSVFFPFLLRGAESINWLTHRWVSNFLSPDGCLTSFHFIFPPLDRWWQFN